MNRIFMYLFSMYLLQKPLIVSATRRRRNKNTFVSVGYCVEKFDIVSNEHGPMQKCKFYVLDRKYPFWVSLVQKSILSVQVKFCTKTNSTMQNSVVMFIFFHFPPKISFLGKFIPKKKKCQFKLKACSGWKCTVGLQKHITFVCLYVLFSCILCFHFCPHVCFHLISNAQIVMTFENRNHIQ